MSVVGRAYVTVRAVTRQVEGDVQKGVDKALGNVEKNMEKAGQDSGKEFGGGMGDGVEKSGVDKKIDKSVKKYDADKNGRDVGNVLGESIGNALLERGPIERAFRRVGQRLAIDADNDGDTIGRRIGRGIGRGLRLGASPMVLLGTLALPAIADALQVVSSAAASATALIGTLGPAMAAVGAVGASSMAAIASGVGAVVLAFKVKSRALDNFKAELRPVRDAWLDIGVAIQREVLPALGKAATSLTVSLGPTLREGLTGAGESIGIIARRLSKLGENEKFQRRLGTVLTSNAVALRNFGRAGVLGLSAMTTITAAATPLTQKTASWTRELLRNVDAQLTVAEESGRLGDWFARAGEITAQWGRILGSLGDALFAVFHAGMDEGGNLLNMLESVTDRFENWAESLEGQNALKQWFEDATPVMQALGDVLGGLVQGLGNWMSGVGEAEDSLSAIADLLPPLGEALGVLSTGFRELVEAVLPAVGSLAEELTPAVADVAGSLGDNLGDALDSILPPLADLLESALQIAGSFAPALPILGDIAGIVGDVLAPAFKGLAAVLDAVPGPIMGVVGAAVALRLALSSVVKSEKFGPMAANVKSSLSSVRSQMAATSGAAGKLRSGLSGAVGMLGGSWGLAIAGATIVIGKLVAMHEQAKQNVDNLTASLDAQTGALTENTRATVVKRLEDEGALEAAQKLGISLDDVTDAALGNEGALNRVRDRLREVAPDALDAGKGFFSFDLTLSSSDRAAHKVGESIQNLGEDLDKAKESTKRTTAAMDDHRESYNRMIPTAGRMAKVEAQLGGAARSTKRDLEGQKRATDGLTRSTIAYHEATLKVIQGNIGFEQAIDDARKELEKGKKTLDIHTQAGRDNVSALLAIAEGAAGVTGSAKKQSEALERGRQKIIDFANQVYKDKDKAQAFADKLISIKTEADRIPRKIDTTINVNDAAARVKLQYFSAAFKGLDGQVARTFIETTTTHIEERLNRASGGWILGPGTSTSDSIRYGNANVSNREFVVNAAAAARNARVLEAINGGQDVSRVAAGSAAAPVNITVNNPVPERAGRSVTSVLRNKVVEAGWSA